MNEFESFSPSESSEGIDPGALDRMREQMKAASQAMKRDQKQEQKQRKTEDSMYSVLVVFINQLGANHPLVILIVRCLKDNVLSEVILTIVSLLYSELHEQVGLELITPEKVEQLQAGSTQALIVPELSQSETPLYLRLNLEIWIKLINTKMFESPVRNLSAIRNKKDLTVAKYSFTDLLSYVAQSYLQNHKVDFNGTIIEKFIRILSKNLIERLEIHVTQHSLTE